MKRNQTDTRVAVDRGYWRPLVLFLLGAVVLIATGSSTAAVAGNGSDSAAQPIGKQMEKPAVFHVSSLFRAPSPLRPDARTQSLPIASSPALSTPAEDDAPARVKGSVRDEAGRPVAEATILKNGLPSARSQGDGSFTMVAEAGQWQLLAEKHGYVADAGRSITLRPGQSTSGVTLNLRSLETSAKPTAPTPTPKPNGLAGPNSGAAPASGATPVVPRPAPSPSLRSAGTSTSGASISIRGYISAGTTPISGAAIYTSSPTGEGGYGTSGADGSYSVAATPNVTHTLKIAGIPGYCEIKKSVSVGSADMVLSVDVDVEAPYTISGTVSNANGTPLSNASISINRIEGSFQSSLSLPAVSSTSYRFKAPAGNWYVSGYEPSYDAGYGVSITVSPETPSAIHNFVFQPYVTLSGRVVAGSSPIAGASIEARSSEGSFWANSSSDGSYAISLAANSNYDITVRQPGYASTVRSTVVNSSAIAGFDFDLDALNPYVVSGTVSKASGQSLNNSTLTLSFGSLYSSLLLPNEATASYRIRVSVGEWRLGVSETGYYSLPQTANVNASTPSVTLSFVLKPTVALSGHIRAVDGVLSRGYVYANSPQLSGWSGYSSVSSEGIYSVEVPGGFTYAVEVNGFANYAPVRKSIAVGSSATLLDIDLDAENPFTISGTVSHADGSPVAAASVSFSSSSSGSSSQPLELTSGITVPFAIHIPAGSWTVTVKESGFVSSSKGAITGPSSSLSFSLQKGATVSGRVTDGANGVPYPSVSAYVDGTWADSVTNNSDGTYSVTVPRNSAVELQFVPQGYSRVVRKLSVGTSDLTVNIDMAVEEPYSISGVVSRSGIPLASATISLSGASGSSAYAYTSTTNSGSYSLRVLGNATYSLQVGASGYASATKMASIGTSSMTLNIDMDAENPYTISGTVSNADGSALTTGAIQISSAGNNYYYLASISLTMGTSTSYSVRVPAGSWNVTVRENGYLISSKDLITGPSATVNHSLEKGVLIAGRVFDGSKSVGYPRISITSSPSQPFWYESNSDGSYFVTVSRSSAVELTFISQGYGSVVRTISTGTAEITLDIDLAITNPYTISGTVNRSGAPVSLGYTNLEGGGAYQDMSSKLSGGSYSFRVAGSQSYRVGADVDGYVTVWKRVTVGGENALVDFDVDAENPYTISGRVRHEDGSPLVEPYCRLYNVDGANFPNTSRALTMMSDSFTVRAPAGRWIVAASDAGYLLSSRSASTAPSATVEISLTRGSVVTGRVVDGETAMSYPSLQLFSDGHRLSLWNSYSDGSFTATVPFNSHVEVRVGLTGYAQVVRAITVGNSSISVPTIDLAETNPYTISGTLSYANSPTSGSSLYLYAGGARVGEGTTSSPGPYSLRVSANRSYEIRATHTGYAPASKTVAVGTSSVGAINIDLDEANPYTVSGTASTSDGQRMIYGRARLYVPGEDASSAVSLIGNSQPYSFKVGPGTWQLWAEETEHSAGTRQAVTLSPSVSTAAVNLSLAPSTTIYGVIRDGQTGFYQATVSAYSNGSLVRSTSTSSVGGYSLLVPRDGTYDVAVEAPGYARVTRKVTLSGNGVYLEVDLTSSNPYTITGTVSNTDGSGLSGARLYFWPANQGIRQSIGLPDGSNGSYRLHVTGGRWIVQPLEAGKAVKSFSVDVGEANPSVALSFSLLKGRTLSGRVLPSGYLSSRIQVEWSGGIVEATTSSDGAYAVSTLPDTEIRLRPRVDGYAPVSRSCAAGTDDLSNLDFDLNALNPYSLSGTVSRSDGRSLTNGSVTVSPSTEGDSGSFYLPDAISASYHFKVGTGSWAVAASDSSQANASGTFSANEANPDITRSLVLGEEGVPTATATATATLTATATETATATYTATPTGEATATATATTTATATLPYVQPRPASYWAGRQSSIKPLLPLTMYGTTRVTQDWEAVRYLKDASSSEASKALFAQLLTAKINLAVGADGSCVDSTIADAAVFLTAHPYGSNPSGVTRDQATSLKTKLDDFNNRGCAVPPTATSTATPAGATSTPTSTATPTATPVSSPTATATPGGPTIQPKSAGAWAGNQTAMRPLLPITMYGTVRVLQTWEASRYLKDASSSDISKALFAQLLAAKLNIAAGATHGCIDPQVIDAEAFLAAHPYGSNPQGADKVMVGNLKTSLDGYNGRGCP